jgi:hypothetical protein
MELSDAVGALRAKFANTYRRLLAQALPFRQLLSVFPNLPMIALQALKQL